MDPRAHLAALVAELPDDAVVPVRVSWLRPLLNGAGDGRDDDDGGDPLLAPAEVARLLGVDRRWVYRHSEELGGIPLTPRCLRFPKAAVDRYLSRRGR